MKIVDSSLYKYVKETHHLPTGKFYFFENLVIAEINEGEHIESKATKAFFELSNSFYSKNKSYGFISNRINKFSVSPLEFANISNKLENVTSICSITYNNNFDAMNIEIEKHFSQKSFLITSTIEEAFSWTNNIVLENQNITA